ncbi:MAG: 4a-hydroxytetrahydrobiopterin dehydratase [Flavobacteriaceae bacterium]|nr:4a-hydroxytetrahydrobiopterin dehydratase [Flavobacteriaceae bacterium]|tara:strand:- start:339 stop:632 length:294 start_codon:yes stop_codon:yes gene_type:complete
MALLKPLTQLEIETKKNQLDPKWELKDGQLIFNKECSDFDEAIAFINTIAALANSQDHHPKIINEYNRIYLSLFTHDSNGITEKDFTLAKAIDALGK